MNDPQTDRPTEDEDAARRRADDADVPQSTGDIDADAAAELESQPASGEVAAVDTDDDDA